MVLLLLLSSDRVNLDLMIFRVCKVVEDFNFSRGVCESAYFTRIYGFWGR